MFAEALPTDCPPPAACEQDGFVVYRLLEAKTPCVEDFASHAARWPQKFGSQCRHYAVSVFSKRESLARLLEMPVHAHKCVARLVLAANSGKVHQTGQDVTHHSWWRYSEFDAVAACEVDE